MAITYVSSSTAQGSSGSLSITLGPCVPGQLIILFLTADGPNSNVTPTISDTVNGTYTQPAGLHWYPGPNIGGTFNMEQLIAYVATTGTGTPTISITGLSTDFWIGIAAYYNGFSSGPTLTTDVTQNQTSTANTSPIATPLTNSYANELMIGCMGSHGGGTAIAILGSLSARIGLTTGPAAMLADATIATSGNTISYGTTNPNSAKWMVPLVGFTDGSAGGFALSAANLTYTETIEATILPSYVLSLSAITYSEALIAQSLTFGTPGTYQLFGYPLVYNYLNAPSSVSAVEAATTLTYGYSVGNASFTPQSSTYSLFVSALHYTYAQFSQSYALGQASTAGQAIVPNVIGLSWYDASAALLKASMVQVTPPMLTLRPGTAPGTVVSQSINAGVYVPIYTVIQLTVTIENLLGATFGRLPLV